MSTTMRTDGALSVGIVERQAWHDAIDLIEGAELPRVEEDIRDAWAAAGIETSTGLDPKWGLALALTREASAGMRLLSAYRGVMFDATALVRGADAVTITQRHKLREGDDGPELEASDPMIEVALAPSAQMWSLLLRVLPPLDVVRAEPSSDALVRGDALVVELDDVPEALRRNPAALAERVPWIPVLPESVRDALHPVASIFAVGLAAAKGGTRAVNDAWAVGERGLYHLVPGEPGVFAVPAGHVGARLVQRFADVAAGRA